MAKLFICLLALGLSTTVLSSALPKSNLCHLSDPELNTCLSNRVESLLQELGPGIPEKDIPPLDPLHLEFMSAEGDLEAVKIKMVMKNITLHGHSSAKVSRVKFDPSTLSGDVTLFVPTMRFLCDYYATGRLFVIPLESSAQFDGNFTGVDLGLNFRLKPIDRKGVTYFTVDKMTMKMRVDTAKVKLTSFDSKYQPQVSVIENFFNNNDRLVLDTVNPIVVLQGPEFYKHVVERYLRKVPAEEILPK